jgi:hypothetical protein
MPDLASSLRELIDGSAGPVDVDGIVHGRRRRRRQRRAIAVGALSLVVAVVAVTVGVTARSTAPHKIIDVGGGSRVSEAEATRDALASIAVLSPGGGSSALTVAPTTIDVSDVATGRHESVRFPVRGAQSILYPFLALRPRDRHCLRRLAGLRRVARARAGVVVLRDGRPRRGLARDRQRHT